MKNNLITGVIAMSGVLIAQNFPVLAGFLIYGILAYLAKKYVADIVIHPCRNDSDDKVARFFISVFWPVTFPLCIFIQYEDFQDEYNFPSFRNPFYWPEK